jgi:hypothetical protein
VSSKNFPFFLLGKFFGFSKPKVRGGVPCPRIKSKKSGCQISFISYYACGDIDVAENFDIFVYADEQTRFVRDDLRTKLWWIRRTKFTVVQTLEGET